MFQIFETTQELGIGPEQLEDMLLRSYLRATLPNDEANDLIIPRFPQ
jgi:hypothetical protein